MTDTTSEESEAPSRVQSMALGDTKVVEPRNVTNVPALIAFIAFWVFLGILGPWFLLMAVGILVMIFLHELGHYMTAKWTGMKSTQFFLGFGPTIISRTRGEVEFGVKALPLGAFVRIIGMSNLDPVDPEDEHRAYRNKSYPRRMLVITAGSAMHFIQAILLFVLAISVIGTFNLDSEEWFVNEITQLETGETPSAQAGIELGDRIVSIDGEELADWASTVEAIQGRPGQTVSLGILRNGEVFQATTTLASVEREDGSTVGMLGVRRGVPRERQSVLTALEVTGATAWQTTKVIPELIFSPATWGNLGSLLFEGNEEVSITSEEAQSRPVSVVGVVRIAGQAAEFDWSAPIFFLAFINVFIGVFNLFPLLPLDGGHAAIATYERLRSRRGAAPYRADIAKLLPITYAVVLLLAFIGLTTIWLDIVRPIS